MDVLFLIQSEDRIGRLYYFNCETEQSSWEHPCDPFYRSLAEQQRLKGSKGSSTTLSMSGLTSIANLHFVDEDIGFKSDANGNSQHSAEKKSTQLESKVRDTKDISFSNIKNNNISDEEVESVDFELEVEEALEDLSSNGAEHEVEEDLVTLDVTEGGADDKKQFKEIHTIELNGQSLVNNEFKYRIDGKTGAESSKSADNSSQSMKDKMQSSSEDGYQSSDGKVKRQSNIKQSSGVGSGGKDTENNVRHNEISDEFLLDESEDPFAEFDGYHQNYNDLFGSLDIGLGSGGSGMPSKYDNSDNYEELSPKPLSNDNQNHSTQEHNKSHNKPLETLLEDSEERDENQSDSSADEVDEDQDEIDLKLKIDDQDNDNDNDVNEEFNEQQIEYKFEEMTKSLTQKISSLRNELRDEITKGRNSINKELNKKINDLDDRVSRNTGALRDTKTEIQDLKQMLSKPKSQMESSVGITAVGSTVKSSDIDRLEKEMQLLRSDVRNESLDSIRELRNELNRDLKSRVNSVFGDLDNKFMDFKDENSREFRAIRTELSNVSNNSKNFGQQMTELRDDLSQTLADIERQRKEHNKRLQGMDSSLAEETQRFQNEVQRLQTLMKTIENRLQELDTERHEIRLLSRLETTEQNTSDCMARIDTIDKQVYEMSQRVYQAFKTVDNQNNKIDAKDDNHTTVVVNRPEQSLTNRDMAEEQTPQETGAVTDDSPPTDILNRMSTIENNIKRISDSFEQMIPIIAQNKNNKNMSQNRNTYLNRRPNETNHNSKSRLKDNKHKYSDEDDYTSRTSSSLLSSSSISDGRTRKVQTSAAKRRHMFKRCSHHSIPINKSHKSGINIKESHNCCIHKDIGDEYYPSERNYRLMKVPLMPTAPHWELQQQSAQQLKHIRTSSSSLLNLIKKTTKKLREEAIELEGLGNYRFITDFEPIASPFKDMNDVNNDETAIKKLKSVRLDVDQRLRKLTNIINQQKSSQI